MEAKVIDSSKNEVSLSIAQSDIGMLYIVQHELLGGSSTDFAGVIVKHPLTNECWMKVTSKNNPIREISRATDSAIKHVQDLEKLFSSNIT